MPYYYLWLWECSLCLCVCCRVLSPSSFLRHSIHALHIIIIIWIFLFILSFFVKSFGCNGCCCYCWHRCYCNFVYDRLRSIRMLVSSQMPFVLSIEQAKRACVSAFSHARSFYFYSFLSAKCSIVCHTFVVSANCDFSVETCAHLYLPKQRRDGTEPYNHRALFCAHVFLSYSFLYTKQSKVTLGIHLFENNKRALPHIDSHTHTHTHIKERLKEK